MIQLEFLLNVVNNTTSTTTTITNNNNNNTSQLNLTFSPTSPNSLAFINGIEIISIPDLLYNGFYDDDPTGSPCGLVKNVENPGTQYSTGGKPVALETVARLNVGGAEVAPEMDSGGLFRTWQKDEDFVDGDFKGAAPSGTPIKINYAQSSIPEYTAPEVVYRTARVMGPESAEIKMRNNLTWEVDVDPGFDYLVRLHFCEIDADVTESNQRVFNIYINNRTAEQEADVMGWAHNVWATPVCRDYVVSAYDDGIATKGSRVPLWISLHPDIEQRPRYHDAILNGMEVFKLSQWNRSLAAPNPDNSTLLNPLQIPTNSSKKHLFPIIGGVAGGVALIASLIVFAFSWRKIRDKAWRNSPTRSKGSNNNGSRSGSNTTHKNESTSLPSHLCKRFMLHQIKLATSNFDENMVIGVGGFGKVYKGSISVDDGELTITNTTTTSNNNNNVAIKRLNPSSKQGAHEFRTEIEMLSVLRHVHLVSLIGYCDEGQEMILVYEYMPRGALRDHLYYQYTGEIPNPPLPWKQRLTVCIGAARGLHYLHVGTNHQIIHRDVKSTNILLDEKFTAKVSDFGLSKVGPTGEAGGPNHVSTLVKGSIGYLDPEYHRWQQLTTKSDVYSFGVVLFEVLCARQAINPTLAKEQVNLALWARSNYKSGTLEEIVDPNLAGQIAPECLRKYGEVAEMCVREEGSERPSMGDVVWGLEFSLQLQLEAEKNDDMVNGGSGLGLGLNPAYVDNNGIVDTACAATTLGESLYQSRYRNGITSTSTGDDNTRSGSVFSEIMHPQGR